MSINLCLGPMFAGKTSWLIDTWDMYVADMGMETIMAIKPIIDTRYSKEDIVSHVDKVSHAQRKIPAIQITSMQEFLEHHLNDQVMTVLIDEGQFIVDLVDGCLRLVDMGIHVYISALNATAEQKPWPVISELIAQADTIEHLQATCAICGMCFAAHTRVKPVDGDCALAKCPKGTSVRIGGANIYEPVCRHCLIMHNA